MKFEDFKVSDEFSEEIRETYRNYYKEIWEENEYERFGVTIPKDGVVVDCGGSIGLFAQYAVHRGAGKVYTFEFHSRIFALMQHNVEGEDKIVATQGFIGHGHFNAHDYQNYPASEQNYEKWSLERIVDHFQLETIDFLKIDVEGGEFDLIDATLPETLSRVKQVSMEVHVWQLYDYIQDANMAAQNAQRFLSMIEKLNLCGFKVSIQKIHTNTCLYMLYASR